MCRPKFALTGFSFAFVFLSSTAAFAKDSSPTSVFDLTLGEPFSIRECKYEVLEQPMGMEGIAVAKHSRGLLGKPDHISKMYRYTEAKPAADKCFQRVGPFYTSSPIPGASLPPALSPNNQKVKLVYADNLRPAIADSEDIWVGIQDSKLTGVRFYFQNRNEQSAFQTVLKKYGQPASNEKFTLQTPSGTLKSYYSAKWSFPKLQVTFLSLDTNQIGYDPTDAPIGYLSEVGSVTVQYKAQEAAKADNNPL
ncbi:MAG: hypothetical protein JSS42_08825 [Proteobacteria bacterium]|nr:hypothetical protein [Pseudomonadota bacterium]